MEVNRAESAAVAAVGGVPADVLDMAGRLVVTPNALTLDGQRNVPADLQPGESLASFLDRHVPGIHSGAWTVMIGGAVVPQAMWVRTFPKHGQLIACRAVLRRSALQLVAIAALALMAPAIAGSIYGALGGTYVAASAGVYLSAIQIGVFIAGSVLINKVLGPKVPSVQSQAQKQIYSLGDQRNSARPYEPIPVLWGEMRVTPDLARKAYAWYEGDDQYLSSILLGGINVHSAADLAIGDTPIGNYSDVSVYYNGFSGMPSQDVPLYSNVDAVAGAEFVNGGDWITRTGAAGTGVLQLDIEGQLYDVDNKGNIKPNWVDLTIEARIVGSSAWATLSSSTITNASTDVLRRTYSFDVAPGQYEVRAKLGVPRWNDGGSGDACKFTWVSLKSVQADTTDYSQWGRIGIKIRASGQLSGSLDQVRATYRAKPMPIWTGTGWATATSRADGLSNPGAILLQTLRGVRDSQGRLQFGFGLSDEQIDIEGLKAFMLHCAARGYTYDKWVTSGMSLGAFCEEVALAGMGEFAWTDGSRPTAVFVTNGQPNSAVVNMANMLKGGFSVDYALSNAADGIEYQWLNRDTWEMTTLRVMAPGVTTMLSPARVTGEGITSEQHAAVMARYHLAQSLYQYKTVHYTADIEHLDYRRLSVLSVSHDLTQWGFGGRVMAAQRIGAQVQLTLDEPVPPLTAAYIGLRVPGARDYRVWPVQPLAAESDVVTLVGEWPEDLDFPGEGIGNPSHDTLWCYDFKATPGYRVRVTGIDPESDLKGARITAVPEGPEFWDYVLNGNYVPAPNQSTIPQLSRPVVKNLRVSEKVNLQGDTEWYELSCIWDVEGDYDHAQVWAGRDGSELRLVDGNAVGSRSTFRIDGAGEWLIEVRPFNPAGRAGQMAVKLYITSQTQLPPRNPGTFVVQQLAGGLRRFAWAYAGDKPAALAGVQIRYLPGDVALSLNDWDGMQPLGDADDIYTAQFETSRPGAGLWTFGLRAIDTAGQLANGIARFAIELGQSFDQIQNPDLTPPPVVTGLSAVGMLTSVQVDWDATSYSQGHGHARTVIYAAAGEDATFDQAEQVVQAYGGPVSFASDPAKCWRVWAKHQTVDGMLSLEPAGPVQVATAMDPGGLLDVLQGGIGRPQLTPAFSGEISEQQERTQELEATARGVRNDLEAEGALADLLNEWQSRVRLREVKRVVAGIDGTLQGTWAVEMDLDAFGNKVAGGFSLVGQAGEAGARLDFSVLANRFVIASPSGTGINPVTPFVVVTVPEVIDGQEIPAGVYMEGAYIKTGTIGRAQIGLAEIDDARITTVSASKLRSGSIEVGNYIQSTNFAEGERGWRITGDGKAEFSGVIVRGAVYATAGSIAGITIQGGGLNSGAYTGYGWPTGTGTGFHLGPGGLLLGNPSTGRYVEIQAGGNFYMPGLRVENGNAVFSGRMTAGVIHNAAQTNVIDLNASGASKVVSFGNGKFTVDGNGNIVADQVDIRRRKSITSGVAYPNLLIRSSPEGNVFTHIIDTGVDYAGYFDQGAPQPLGSYVYIETIAAESGGVDGYYNTPAGASAFYVTYTSRLIINSMRDRDMGVLTSVSRIYIEVSITIKDNGLTSLIRGRANGFQWSIFRM